LGAAAFFIVVMLTLLLGMEWYGWFAAGSEPNPPGWKFAPLNVRQVSIFFSVYVFFQVWNQINCRSLTPEHSGFYRLFANPTFLAIAGTVAVVQVAITSVPVLSGVFEVAPLGWQDWAWIVFGTSSVLVFAEIWRRVRLAIRKP
jgi:Ca2+-transporting ATPase